MIKLTKNWFSLSGGIVLVAAYLTSTAVLGQTVNNSSGVRIAINTPAKYEDRKSENLRPNPKQQRQAYSFDDPVRIIVRFKSRWRPEGQLGTHTERIRQRKQTLREATRFVARISRYRPQEVRTFETVPLVSMVIERKNLERLRRYPQVLAVQEDIPAEVHLGSSLPVVGANTVQTSGYGGEGQTVVIIDTGVDTNNNNPNFTAGQIVAQGCFNPAAGGVTTNLCPGGATNLIGPAAINQNAGDDICGPPVGATGTCEHGTHVASIAAGINGVAPEADIISLQVFHLRTNPNPLPPFFPPGNLPCPNQVAGTQCILANQADIIAALNQATVLADSFDIAAVNMSLGGGNNNAACDADLAKVSIDNLRSRGIATVVSSGNQGFINAMEAPACISTAISVGSTVDTQLPVADNATGGAVYVQDLVSRYSNVAPFLDLHAPGTLIVGGAPVNSPCDNNFGPNGDGQCRMSGTSMAAPHVTGAWAALKSLNPAARVEDVLAILQATGVAVADNRLNTTNGLTAAGLPNWTGNVGAATQVPRVSIDLAMERFDPHRGSIVAGDFNCDGRRDVAMGHPKQTVNGQGDAGEVSILYGSSKGAVAWVNRHINQNSKDKNGKKANGQAEAGDRFGHAVAAGDFNDDGCDDLVVGIPFESVSSNAGQGPKAGMVQVFYGKPWGFDMNMDQLWHQNSAGIAGAAEEGDKFGWSLATGDFDNDGLDDLAIGTPTESIGTVPASGAVTVIFGHGAGLESFDSQMLHQDNLPLSTEAGDLFGYAVSAGDFNNDGFSDLAIGAPRDTTTADDSGNDAGLVTVWSGSVTGVKTNAGKVFHQGVLNAALESGDRFGFSLANGDFNNDGFDDLAIGVPFEDLEFTNGDVIEDAGVIHVVLGSNSGLSSNGNTIFSQNTPSIKGKPEAGDAFGYSLASGDFDKDGFVDLAIGVPFEDIEASNAVDAGAVNVIPGSVGGLTAQNDQLLYQSAAGMMGTSESFDRFGDALAAGNIRPVTSLASNQLEDLVVRVSGENMGTSDSGAVQLFYGKSGVGLSKWDKFITLDTF